MLTQTGLRILVVDDEPDLETLVVQKFRRQIRDGSVSFVFAQDGVEALQVVEGEGGVDLVVSDINMPRLDGLALLARLQQIPDAPSTVIVSAYGDMANIRTAMNHGAFDFLTKPIDFTDLELTMAKTMRHVAVLRDARARQHAAERAHAALSRYFSPNLAARLAADDGALDLAGQWRQVTSVFTDIKGFSRLVQTMEARALGVLLNDYLAGMTNVVFRHEGTVAKIIGDALHILFGAPGDQPDHPARAVACALELDAFAQDFRAKTTKTGIALGTTRIGAHTGRAIVGNFGGTRFFDYTAYGETINLAARLESANKALGTRTCVSKALADQVPGFVGRPVGELILRGHSVPMLCFEPLPPDQVAATIDGYLAAYQMMESGDDGAMAAFASLVGTRPDDSLAGFHLRRLLNGEKGTRIALE
jgi:adenylate cyclase